LGCRGAVCLAGNVNVTRLTGCWTVAALGAAASWWCMESRA